MDIPITDYSTIERFLEITRHNLLALENNLNELGYEFANSDGPVQFADTKSKQTISYVQEKGEVPSLYQEWYKLFRCVDFTQNPSQLYDASGHPLAGLGLNCSLVLLSIPECLRLQEELKENGLSIRSTERQELIPLGGSASNCEPKGIWIPDGAIDPVIYDEGSGPVTMAGEVISSLDSGGFPFWAKMFRRRRIRSPIGVLPAYDEVLPALRRDIRDY